MIPYELVHPQTVKSWAFRGAGQGVVVVSFSQKFWSVISTGFYLKLLEHH